MFWVAVLFFSRRVCGDGFGEDGDRSGRRAEMVERQIRSLKTEGPGNPRGIA